MEKIILIGGGGHCKSVIDVIEKEAKFEIAGIVDVKENIGKKVLAYKIIACDDELIDLRQKYKYALITVGQIKSPNLRIRLFKKLKDLNFILPVITSPMAYVSKYASIDEGSVIMHNAFVNANACIGKNCIINTKALIEHDVKIEDNCHISTASVINGGVLVKENTFFGSNATTKQETVVSGFIKAGELIR